MRPDADFRVQILGQAAITDQAERPPPPCRSPGPVLTFSHRSGWLAIRELPVPGNGECGAIADRTNQGLNGLAFLCSQRIPPSLGCVVVARAGIGNST